MYRSVVSLRLPGHRTLALVLSLALVGPVGAQAPAAAPVDRGAFVVMAGRDTVAVERFARTPSGVESELLVKKDGSRVRQVFRYAADGRAVESYSVETFGAGSGQFTPTARVTLRFVGDSMIREGGAQETATRSAVVAGTLPWANLSTIIMEEMTRRARAVGGARVELPLVAITGDAEFLAHATPVGSDSISLSFSDVMVRLAVDGRGRILGGRIPSQGVTIVRTRSVDPAPRRGGGAGSRGATRP